MRTAPDPPAPRRFHRRLAWVALAALVLRIIYLLELRGEALVAVPVGDGWQYDEWARRIAAGEWLGGQAFYQTPLYPYFLAAIYAAVGHSLMAVRAIQAVLGAAACVLLGVAGRRFFSDRAGLIAAGMLAVYPWAIFSDGLIQKSSLDAVLIASVLASLAVFLFRPHWKWLIAAGLALGAFSLNRETGRLLYPVVVFWLLSYFRACPAPSGATHVGGRVHRGCRDCDPAGRRLQLPGQRRIPVVDVAGGTELLHRQPRRRLGHL